MAEGALHQKPREVCITEDTESIDLGWFENTKWNHVKNDTTKFVTSGRSRLGFTGTSPSMIQNPFVKRWQKLWDVEAEEEEAISIVQKDHEWRKRVPFHVFNVNDFLRLSPNPFVASVFGNPKIIRRAAVRRGHPVMKSKFLNFKG